MQHVQGQNRRQQTHSVGEKGAEQQVVDAVSNKWIHSVIMGFTLNLCVTLA